MTSGLCCCLQAEKAKQSKKKAAAKASPRVCSLGVCIGLDLQVLHLSTQQHNLQALHMCMTNSTNPSSHCRTQCSNSRCGHLHYQTLPSPWDALPS